MPPRLSLGRPGRRRAPWRPGARRPGHHRRSNSTRTATSAQPALPPPEASLSAQRKGIAAPHFDCAGKGSPWLQPARTGTGRRCAGRKGKGSGCARKGSPCRRADPSGKGNPRARACRRAARAPQGLALAAPGRNQPQCGHCGFPPRRCARQQRAPPQWPRPRRSRRRRRTPRRAARQVLGKQPSPGRAGRGCSGPPAAGPPAAWQWLPPSRL
mmetsp:Transcript_65229/g.199519  ORF Transcript_65229/g.199519 Transcript_65229/m.199519 type:complete len:213 (-) Transcript_65229:616-1254(-)